MNHVSVRSTPLALTDIMNNDITLSVWARQPTAELQREAAAAMTDENWRDLRVACTVNQVEQVLHDHLATTYPALQADICLLADMFQCLFDADSVAIRLARLQRAMCPRFHTDKIPCRLVNTYHGSGTEWLGEDAITREYLGRGANGNPDHSSGLIKEGASVQRLNPFDVGLLKGDAWPDNDGRGLVHRSPAAGENERRLLLTLDFA